MAKLYEINREIEDLIRDNFDSETGMLNPDIQDALEKLEMERVLKILNVGKFIKNLESDYEQHKSEAKRQNEIASKLQKKAEKLREYMNDNVNLGELFDDSQVTIGWSSRPSIDISAYMVDPLPDKYISKTVKYTIRKALVLEDIKDHGFEHPGVSIKYNLIIK